MAQSFIARSSSMIFRNALSRLTPLLHVCTFFHPPLLVCSYIASSSTRTRNILKPARLTLILLLLSIDPPTQIANRHIYSYLDFVKDKRFTYFVTARTPPGHPMACPFASLPPGWGTPRTAHYQARTRAFTAPEQTGCPYVLPAPRMGRPPSGRRSAPGAGLYRVQDREKTPGRW